MKTYTVKVDNNGNKRWYSNDKLHREDGPAIEYANGDKCWYINDKRHREDGPAIEYVNGDKEWYSNDELHREDGPAIEFADGDKHWWINGQRLTEQEVLNLLQTLEIERTWPGSTSKWWALKKVA